MKYLKSILILTTVLTLSLTVVSSYGLSNKSLNQMKNNEVTKNVIVSLPKTDTATDTKQLHGDVWFAFSAIGVIGAYLAFKK